jgi:hypothetical protein
MVGIIILNVALAVFVVVGILALLGWGIASDRVVAAKLTERRRAAQARRRQSAHRPAGAQRAAYRGGPVYTRGS